MNSFTVLCKMHKCARLYLNASHNIFHIALMSKEEVDARCYPLAKDELAGQIHNMIEQAGRVNGLICGAN